jgi:hypothetical protein
MVNPVAAVFSAVIENRSLAAPSMNDLVPLVVPSSVTVGPPLML